MRKLPKTIRLSEIGIYNDIKFSLPRSRLTKPANWQNLTKRLYLNLASKAITTRKLAPRGFFAFKRWLSKKDRSLTIRIKWVLIGVILINLIPNTTSSKVIYADPITPLAEIKQIKPLPTLSATKLTEVAKLAPPAIPPMGSFANTYAAFNCTWYAASRVAIPNNWGNANTWAYAAISSGYNVSNVPLLGSIAQTSGDSFLGHVAVVEAVYSNTTFLVSEMNYYGLGVVDTRSTSTAEFQNFIYR